MRGFSVLPALAAGLLTGCGRQDSDHSENGAILTIAGDDNRLARARCAEGTR